MPFHAISVIISTPGIQAEGQHGSLEDLIEGIFGSCIGHKDVETQ